MDGLRGPLFTGTGYYLKKNAMFCSPDNEGMTVILGINWKNKLST